MPSSYLVIMQFRIASEISAAARNGNHAGLPMYTHESVIRKARMRRYNSNGRTALSAVTETVSAALPGTTDRRWPTDLSTHDLVRSDYANQTEIFGGEAVKSRYILPSMVSMSMKASGRTILCLFFQAALMSS